MSKSNRSDKLEDKSEYDAQLDNSDIDINLISDLEELRKFSKSNKLNTFMLLATNDAQTFVAYQGSRTQLIRNMDKIASNMFNEMIDAANRTIH